MNISRRMALALPAGALALATLALAANAFAAERAPAVAAHPTAPSPGWRLSKTISIRDRSVLMIGIAAVGDDDAWAAGTSFSEYGTMLRPVLEHWDGASWRRVSLPANVARQFGGQDIFANVGALSADDVWAITYPGRYLWLHDRRWTTGRLPDTKTGKVVINAIKTFSPTDIWAFGSRSVGNPSRVAFAPYTARFDGRRWATIPVPGRGYLGPVTAVSASDIWAVVGEPFGGRGVPGGSKVIRWNGAKWIPVLVQPRLPKDASVVGILATKDSDVWIGGSVPNSKGGTSEMARHWNGKAWTQASPHSAATSQDYYLASFVADGRGGFWAIGGNLNGGPQRMWHRSGGSWSAPLRSPWQLYQLADVPGSTSIWGVGWYSDQIRGLIVLHGPVPR